MTLNKSVRWICLVPLAAGGAHVAAHVVQGPLFGVAVRATDAIGLGFESFEALWLTRSVAVGATFGALLVLLAVAVAPSHRRAVATLAFAVAAGWALWAAWSVPVPPIPGGHIKTALFATACVIGGAAVWARTWGQPVPRVPTAR